MGYLFSNYLTLLALAILSMVCGDSFAQTKRNDSLDITVDCDSMMSILQKEIFFSCPISKGPDSSILFLNKLPGFIQSSPVREEDHLGSTMYKARNASLFNLPLMDDSTVIALTYKALANDTKVLETFVGDYYFKNSADRNNVYNRILYFFRNTLHLQPNEYGSDQPATHVRYDLPCQSILYIKQLTNKTNDGIRLLWLNPTKVAEKSLREFTEQLLAAPDTIQMAERTFFLKTNMRKDYMPMIPDSGPPSYFNFTLFADDPATLEDSIYIDRIWIINQQKEIWTTSRPVKKYNHDAIGPDFLDIKLKEGPFWEAPISVDVIVRIGDTKGHQYLLRAPNQWIRRTE